MKAVRITFRWVLRGLALLLAVAAISVTMTSCASTDRPLSEAPTDSLRLATYNVHYIIMRRETGPWSVGDWERRKGPLDAAFKAMDADIVAFQEMESFPGGPNGNINLARDFLLERNPGYAAAASGDARVFPSTQPIFYRTDRLEMLDQGWFFFSESPDIIYSRTFNGSYPAFASWAAFEADGKRFRVVNVHTDYASFENRRRSSSLVQERIAPWIAAGERVIVAGDLNAREGGTPQSLIEKAGIAWLPISGATYHFNRGLNLFGAISHIGHSAGVAPIGETQVLRRRFEGEWPTDHYPVLADIVLR